MEVKVRMRMHDVEGRKEEGTHHVQRIEGLANVLGYVLPDGHPLNLTHEVDDTRQRLLAL